MSCRGEVRFAAASARACMFGTPSRGSKCLDGSCCGQPLRSRVGISRLTGRRLLQLIARSTDLAPLSRMPPSVLPFDEPHGPDGEAQAGGPHAGLS